MDQPKLTGQRAELIINLLRDNPGVSLTLGDISDETGIPVEELGAHLQELEDHKLIFKETTDDGFDIFYFPNERQRGTS
jgi:predicted transcriptional regulator